MLRVQKETDTEIALRVVEASVNGVYMRAPDRRLTLQ